MRARVYRNVETRNTLLGLAFPSEVLVVLIAVWVALLTLPPLESLLAILAAYVLVRLSSYGRAPLFLQHFLSYQLRRATSGGRLSAAARARVPQFPHGRYESRDLPPKAVSRSKEVR